MMSKYIGKDFTPKDTVRNNPYKKKMSNHKARLLKKHPELNNNAIFTWMTLNDYRKIYEDCFVSNREVIDFIMTFPDELTPAPLIARGK